MGTEIKTGAESDAPVRVERLVRRVDRSPMNALRWCIELECGHEEWATSKRRPTKTKMKCSTCIAPNDPSSDAAADGKALV